MIIIFKIIDVFHWTCLNKYCSSLPSNTAPAGYCCCDCNTPIFPSSSTPSPIYATLKKKLSTTQWARIGLGLPINSSSLSVDSNSSTAVVVSSSENQIKTIENSANLIQQTFDQKKNLNSNVFIVHHNPESQTINSLDQSIKSTIPVSVNNVSNYLNNNHNLHHTNHNNFSSFNASTRKIAMDSDYSTRDRDRLILDIDDDKYRHRSALDRLSRNFKLNIKFLNYKLNLNANQRLTILICFIVLILFTIFYYLVKQAREADDPLLDPRYNPNIHIQDVDNFN